VLPVRRLAAAVLSICCVLGGVFSVSSARASCPIAGLPIDCVSAPPAAPAPAPDPGGSESPNQPVPYPGKLWGFNLGYPATGSATTALAALAATGAQVLRDNISWAAFSSDTSPSQPIPPEMNAPLGDAAPGSVLAHYDQEYLDLTGAGITPDFIIGQAPLWASTLHDCAETSYFVLHAQLCGNTQDPGQPLYPDSSYYPQWAAFVAAVARRYPEAIIEGPNEPDYAYSEQQAGEGYPGAVDASQAAAIQCELFDAVRSVDDRMVLSSGMSIPGYYTTFIEDAHGCYDAFSFHAYPYATSAGSETYFGAGSGLAQEFADLRSAREAAGDTTPIWVTETGFEFTPSSIDSTSPADQAQEETFADASRRLYNRLMTMPDVGAVLFHTLRDVSDHYGFFNNDWTPKPRACYFVTQHGGSWPGC